MSSIIFISLLLSCYSGEGLVFDTDDYNLNPVKNIINNPVNNIINNPVNKVINNPVTDIIDNPVNNIINNSVNGVIDGVNDVVDELPDMDKVVNVSVEQTNKVIPAKPQNWANQLALDLVQALPALPGLEGMQTKCYEDLGCFSSHDYFHIINRPISLLPLDPEEINATFHLFTCSNKYRPVIMNYNPDVETILKSPFDPNKKTKIIIHGYRGSYDDMDWNGDIKDFILDKECDKNNVIGIDWSKGSKVANYLIAVANTRVVGAMTAFFINRLMNVTEAKAQDFHLIGHSLGSHVAGYAGARIQNPKIGRITALDPAGPAFQSNDPDSRLDQTDATLVTAIHTDSGDNFIEGFGIEDTLGHYDIYPNGGCQQPGCEPTRGVSNFLLKGAEGISDTVICNHRRAYYLPVADPTNILNKMQCQHVAYECENYKSFEDGKCADCGDDGEKCKLMGLWLDFWDDPKNHLINETQAPKKFYIKTNEMTPFCLFHYQVVLHTSKNSSSTTGKITISLFGERRDKDNIELCQIITRFAPSTQYTYLLTYPKHLGKVINAQVKWSHGGIDQLNPLHLLNAPSIIIDQVDVNYLSNINKKIRDETSSKLCPISDGEIKDGKSLRYELCNIL